MKKLIVVRHGDCDRRDDQLNDLGRDQISRLAGKLKPIIDGGTVLILSSTAARARESAEILAKSFGVTFEEHQILLSGGGRREDLLGALALVRARMDLADVLILVTHMEYADRFPEYFAKEVLGVSISFPEVERGEAVVIDCLPPTMIHIKP